MLRLLGQMTMQRMLERDDFTKRIKAGTPIYLHECLYPLMQGWDSRRDPGRRGTRRHRAAVQPDGRPRPPARAPARSRRSA